MNRQLLCLISVFFFTSIYSPTAWASQTPPAMNPLVQRAVYKAQQAIQDGHHDEAAQELENFIARYPQRKHYMIELTLANALALSNKTEQALTHFLKTIELHPKCFQAMQNLGKLYLDRGEYTKAAETMLQAYRLSKDQDPALLYYAAVAFLLSEKYTQALPHLEYLVSGKAGNPRGEWLEALLKVYGELRMNAQALQTVQRLIRQDGNNARWWKYIAHLYLMENDYQKAANALIIYSYITAATPEELILLGDLHSMIGLPLKAADFYERALSSGKAGNTSDYQKIAAAYIMAHRPRQAIATLRQALQKTETAELWHMLGQLLYEEEQFAEAYAALQKSAALKSGDGSALLLMGYTALQMGNRPAALKAFQEAVRFSQQMKAANKILRQLSASEE